jgi:hypothetical protein
MKSMINATETKILRILLNFLENQWRVKAITNMICEIEEVEISSQWG